MKIILLFVLSILGFSPDARALDAGARATVVSGDVSLGLYDARSPLRAGEIAPPNSVVRTGGDGRVTLIFFDGSRVEIEPDSEIFLIDSKGAPRGETPLFTVTDGVARLTPGDSAARGSKPAVVHTPYARVRVGEAPLIIQTRDGKNHIYAERGGDVFVHDKTSGENLEIFEPGAVTAGPARNAECGSSACLLKHLPRRR